MVSLDGLSLVAVETCTAKNARSILSRRDRPRHDHTHRVLFLTNRAPLPVLFIVHAGTFCLYIQYVLELDALSRIIMRSWYNCRTIKCQYLSVIFLALNTEQYCGLFICGCNAMVLRAKSHEGFFSQGSGISNEVFDVHSKHFTKA